MNDSGESTGSESEASDSHHSGDESNTSHPNSPARRNPVPQQKREEEELQDDGNSNSTDSTDPVNEETFAEVDDSTNEEPEGDVSPEHNDANSTSKLEDHFYADFTDRQVAGNCKAHEAKLRAAWNDTLEILKLAEAKATRLLFRMPELEDDFFRMKQISQAL